MSYRKKIDFHVNYRRSKHWDESQHRLRNILLGNRGSGEPEFQKALDKLRNEYGNVFNYIPQWPIFIESKGQMQAFFIDFLIPKLRLCVEIDGGNHQESTQSSWDEWRSDLIRTEGFFIARYDSKTILSGRDFIKDSVIQLAQRAIPDKVFKDRAELSPLTYTEFLTPLKYKGKRHLGRGKHKAKLDICYARCARCGCKTWHINDHVKKAMYCKTCQDAENLFLLSLKDGELNLLL